MKKILSFCFALIVISFTAIGQTNKKPKNIILLIGDGMGLSQVSSAYFYGEKEPNFSRFPVTGLMKTSSADRKITDSAAGATAFSTGKKTNNGHVGIDTAGKDLQNLCEYFNLQNKSNGLVATSSITHATPACFFAHQRSRNAQYAIAKQMVNSPIHFFAGGGQKFFSEGGNGDLMKKLKENGFQLHLENLCSLSDMDTNKKQAFILAEEAMPQAKNRDCFLKKSSLLAVDYLSKDEDGFFLMIEGSQIDWAGHANFKNYLIREVLDFDETLGAILDFAEKDGETLVIVTADHETGGFSLSGKSKKFLGFERSRSYAEIDPDFNTRGHSATMVPVFAFGPGAFLFTGVYENTEIHSRILKLVSQ